MSNNSTIERTVLVFDLAVGDIVYGIGDTTFTEPHTVIRTVKHNDRNAVVYATGGCFWPTMNGLGSRLARVTR